MKKISFVITAFLILLVISCGKQEYSEEGIYEIVQETDSLLLNLAGQEYNWASAKAYSTVLAYYPKPDIVFINENLTYRKPAEAFNLYYYKDGTLIHFIGKKLEYFYKNKKSSKSKVNKRVVKLTLYLDPDGDVISYNKLVNAELMNLDDENQESVIKMVNKLSY